jgi:hypothetical protein
MTRMGAIMAAGILDAGGRNATIGLRARSGHFRWAAAVLAGGAGRSSLQAAFVGVHFSCFKEGAVHFLSSTPFFGCTRE